MIKKYLVFAFLIIGTSKAISQSKYADSIDGFVKRVVHEFKEIPGLAITVIQDGNPILTKAYGYADIENNQKARTQTPYYIASITKSFVGLLAAILEEEGLFSLNDPIVLFAPIKDFEDKSLFEGITINDLLSHTSGIENGVFTGQFASIGTYTRDDLNEILEFKTNSRGSKSFRYDNLGYNILDVILYEEFNLNWKDLLKEKVFSPIGLKNTSAYLSDATKYGWSAALPYTSINDTRLPLLAETRKNDATFQAAGGMIVSIEDAKQWILANLHEGKVKGKQLVSSKAMEKSHRQITKGQTVKDIFKDDGYGLGWINASYNDKKVLYHYGGFDGAFSHISFMPEENIGLAIFVNESHFGDNISGLIASYVYDLLLGENKTQKDFDENVKSVRSRIDRVQEAFAEDRLNRKDRTWKLKHDQEKYFGDYKSDLLGTLRIKKNNGVLIASLGISKSVVTPSLNDDSIRVEFRDSRGRDILFVSDKHKVIAAVYRGKVYLKQ